jgi:carbamate kinase
MNESLELPVSIKGETHCFTASIQAYGYVYKLAVDIHGTEVVFEKDEQGDFRAILASPEGSGKADAEIIKAILDTLASIGKG